MRIAIPIRDGKLCAHFGRADGFWLAEADPDRRRIERPRTIVRRPHGCESVPAWLGAIGVTTILAGGIGAVAREHFAALGITVSAGHTAQAPQRVAVEYLARGAPARPNPCAAFARRRRHCRRRG